MKLAVVGLLAVLLVGCAPMLPGPAPSAGPSATGYGGAELTTPYQLPKVSLSDESGKPFDLSTGSDAPVLIFYFGYTNCPDICLGVLTDLASALNRVPDADRARIQVLFVTVDPDRDTPPVLAKYLSRIDPDFIGLTGTAAEIEKVAGAMGVGIQGIEQRPDGGYEVNHTAQVVGFDKQRRGVLVWTQGTAIGTYRADFERLVRQQG